MTRSAASGPWRRSSVSTTATISPANRATSPAITGRGIRSSRPGIATGSGSSPMSAAVNARAPGISDTALVSMPVIRACGRIERTNVACSAPCASTSSPKVAVPVMNRGSSLRATRLPRMLMGGEPYCAPIAAGRRRQARRRRWRDRSRRRSIRGRRIRVPYADHRGEPPCASRLTPVRRTCPPTSSTRAWRAAPEPRSSSSRRPTARCSPPRWPNRPTAPGAPA